MIARLVALFRDRVQDCGKTDDRDLKEGRAPRDAESVYSALCRRLGNIVRASSPKARLNCSRKLIEVRIQGRGSDGFLAASWRRHYDMVSMTLVASFTHPWHLAAPSPLHLAKVALLLLLSLSLLHLSESVASTPHTDCRKHNMQMPRPL